MNEALQSMHQAHKDRVSRMGGNNPYVPSSPASDRQLAELTLQMDAMVGRLAAMEKQHRVHTALIGRLLSTHTDDDKPKFGEIMDSVCEFYNVTRNDLLSSRRTADLVMPRQIVCYLGRHMTGMSFPQMGRRLGGRDHTTALHAATKISRLLEGVDETLRDDIDVLQMKIGAKVMERRFGSSSASEAAV